MGDHCHLLLSVKLCIVQHLGIAGLCFSHSRNGVCLPFLEAKKLAWVLEEDRRLQDFEPRHWHAQDTSRCFSSPAPMLSGGRCMHRAVMKPLQTPFLWGSLLESPSYPLARLSGKGDQAGVSEATGRKKSTPCPGEPLGHLIVGVLRGTGLIKWKPKPHVHVEIVTTVASWPRSWEPGSC